MHATRVSTPWRRQTAVRLAILGGIVPVALALIGLRLAQAGAEVKFLSEKFEGTLVAGENNTYTTTVPTTVQNAGTEDTQISFCALPKGVYTCTGKEVSLEIVADDGNIYSTTLLAGRIRTLDLAVTVMPTAEAQSTDAQTPTVKAPSKDGKTEDSPKEYTGLLILRVTDENGQKEAAAIPYTLTPEGPRSVLDKLKTTHVVWGAWGIALFAVIAAVWTIVTAEDGLPFPALVKLRMGVSEWKLGDSWAANLSLAIAIFAGIKTVLPAPFKGTFDSLTFLFGVLTAIAAFAYNATTHPGPETEEDKDTPKKQGWTWVFLFTSLLIVWSLLGQLGLQAMAVERLRDGATDVPGVFLVAFEWMLLLLVLFAAYFTFRRLRETILDQKVKEHKDAYKQRPAYDGKVQAIERYAVEWQEKMKSEKELTQDDQSIIRKGFAAIVLKPQSGSDDNYRHFSALFNDNLPFLLGRVANSQEAAKNLFKSIAEDAQEARELLKRTLPVEDVVAAFYSSLWVPADLRRKWYADTLNKLIRHVKVACAQARSDVEPDRVLGPNEELFTSVTATLDELNKAFGLIGDKDPYYANVKWLFDKAKVKWEVLEINALRRRLCTLADGDPLEECKSKLANLYKVKGDAVAKWLQEVAEVLDDADWLIKLAGALIEAEVYEGPPFDCAPRPLAEWLAEPANTLHKAGRYTGPPCEYEGEELAQWIKELAEKLDKADLPKCPLPGDLGVALAMSLEPLARALGEAVYYPKPFPIDVKAFEDAYGKIAGVVTSRRKVEGLESERKALAGEASDLWREAQAFGTSFDLFQSPFDWSLPLKGQVKEAISAHETKAAETDVEMGKEIDKLQQLLADVDTGAYSAPDEEAREARAQALRNSSLMKVRGRNVRVV